MSASMDAATYSGPPPCGLFILLAWKRVTGPED